MLLVDGNNVVGARPDTRWWRDRAGAQARLAAELGGLGEPVLVVFDGAPHPVEPAAGVEVRFASRRGRDAADDDIAAYVSAHADPAALTVVTADAALADRVRAAGASVVGPRSLLGRLGAP